jgi:hypothetical protein
MNTETQAPEYKEADRQAAREPVVPAAQARQGVTGHNVRYVLAFGTAAVVIAFVIVYLVYFG